MKTIQNRPHLACGTLAKLTLVVMSHSLTVPSHPPEARVSPSKNDTEETVPPCLRVPIFCLVATSHNSIPPQPPEARIVPSGENDTERIISLCSRVAIFSSCCYVPQFDRPILAPGGEDSPVGKRHRKDMVPMREGSDILSSLNVPQCDLSIGIPRSESSPIVRKRYVIKPIPRHQCGEICFCCHVP